ncbi:MAG: response regulator [Bryobacteraceae bacterium]|jgi:DNA-binding NarL/FixJ family response regulator
MREYSILFIRTEEHPAKQYEASLLEGFEGKIEWVRVEALFDGLRTMQERSFDLIISDLFLPDGQGLATVRHLKQHAPQTPVIVLCHTSDRDTAVNAVRKGAHDFVCYEDLNDPMKLRRAVAGALKSGDDNGATKDGEAERRTNARFPCRLAVSYQALEHPFLSGVATSETLNISSKGLLFSTEEALQPGQLLQVSVDWPARLENQVPLKLVAEGRIVRNLNGQAAMRIDKYEFRTRRTKKPGESIKNQPSSRPEETAADISSRPGAAAGIGTTGVRVRRNG